MLGDGGHCSRVHDDVLMAMEAQTAARVRKGSHGEARHDMTQEPMSYEGVAKGSQKSLVLMTCPKVKGLLRR